MCPAVSAIPCPAPVIPTLPPPLLIWCSQLLGAHPRPIVHRLAVFDNTGNLTNIISQTDVVRFLSQHIEELGELGQATVKELGFLGGQVVSVAPDMSAIDALIQMEEGGLSAVAVVDGAGGIIGNFSVSELRWVYVVQAGIPPW